MANKPSVPPMAAPERAPVDNGSAVSEGPRSEAPPRDERPLFLPTWQAQEILDFLGQCPAGQVYNLIGYILTAKSGE